MVDFVSEYRVYCVNSEVKGIGKYKGDSDAPSLDRETVDNAVKILFASPEGQGLSGCSLDFGVMKKVVDGVEQYETTLIEVNDGFSLGRYEGVSEQDYTDLLITRWK